MLQKIIIHKVGNKINQEPLVFGSEVVDLEEDMKELLTEFFYKSFKSEEQFQFYSEDYLANNPVYSSVAKIFENPENFVDSSKEIAQHLYDITENPRVQNGELFVVLFDDANEKGDALSKIGIFKTENKLPFLKIFRKNEDEDDVEFQLEKDFGISLAKLDKGALIHNVSKENGFAVSVIDNNKNGDEYYWFEDFLKVRQRNDDYFQTQETLQVYKDYIMKQLPQEFEVTKMDQADFLNRSLEFFKEKEQFSFDEFTKQILQDEQVIESFENYKSDYEQEMQLSIEEDFPINNAAVKKNQRYFKSVIKLDKNFHIYVHGDRKLIETGQDEKGKFYRLYFEEEN